MTQPMEEEMWQQLAVLFTAAKRGTRFPPFVRYYRAGQLVGVVALSDWDGDSDDVLGHAARLGQSLWADSVIYIGERPDTGPQRIADTFLVTVTGTVISSSVAFDCLDGQVFMNEERSARLRSPGKVINALLPAARPRDGHGRWSFYVVAEVLRDDYGCAVHIPGEAGWDLTTSPTRVPA